MNKCEQFIVKKINRKVNISYSVFRYIRHITLFTLHNKDGGGGGCCRNAGNMASI